jgi:hypothetical protein
MGSIPPPPPLPLLEGSKPTRPPPAGCPTGRVAWFPLDADGVPCGVL